MNPETARFNMVEQQIRPWNVLNQRVLDTMKSVPRERFVPFKYRNLAFADMDIPIGHGQVMMQPKVEARLLQALEPKRDELALEIGAGSGHTAALLSRMAKNVLTVEIREELAAMARANLDGCGIDNVEVVNGDGAEGWECGFAPDCIVISGSVPVLPESYRRSLAVGGRLAAIVGTDPIMNAIVIERTSDSAWNTTFLFETNLPPLDNAEAPVSFKF